MKTTFKKAGVPSLTGMRGLAMAELIMVVPVLFVILGGAFEFSRYLRASQSLSGVSRLGANYVARDCSEYGEQSDLTVCMQTATDQMVAIQSETLIDLTVILSVFKLDETTGLPVLASRTSASSAGNNRTITSHYDLQDFAPDLRLREILNAKKTLIVSEAQSGYVPVLINEAFDPLRFGLNEMIPNTVYEATVY